MFQLDTSANNGINYGLLISLSILGSSGCCLFALGTKVPLKGRDTLEPFQTSGYIKIWSPQQKQQHRLNQQHTLNPAWGQAESIINHLAIDRMIFCARCFGTDFLQVVLDLSFEIYCKSCEQNPHGWWQFEIKGNNGRSFCPGLQDRNNTPAKYCQPPGRWLS